MGYTTYWDTAEWDCKDIVGWRRALPVVADVLGRHRDIVRYEL